MGRGKPPGIVDVVRKVYGRGGISAFATGLPAAAAEISIPYALILALEIGLSNVTGHTFMAAAFIPAFLFFAYPFNTVKRIMFLQGEK